MAARVGKKREASQDTNSVAKKRTCLGGTEEAVRAVVSGIPRGQTLTKMEVFGAALERLVMRGDPGWHRVVSADGGFWTDKHGQAKKQLLLLRRDDARPRLDESVATWARRVKAAFVGCYKLQHGDRIYASSKKEASVL